MSRTLFHPPTILLDEVQHFVMEDASWDLYEKLLRDIGNRPIRVTYDEGRMEVMSPLPQHERPKRLLGRMIETLTLELDMQVASLGSTTFRARDKAKGLEPDECYYFRDEERMRGKQRLDLKKDPAPELVVEIDITARSVPREPIYAALGVPEIWRHRPRCVECLHLIGGEYHARKMSLAFPFLEPALLERFIEKAAVDGETAMVRQFVAWVRKNGWV
jgi:Uma2 family endonuclease